MLFYEVKKTVIGLFISARRSNTIFSLYCTVGFNKWKEKKR